MADETVEIAASPEPTEAPEPATVAPTVSVEEFQALVARVAALEAAPAAAAAPTVEEFTALQASIASNREEFAALSAKIDDYEARIASFNKRSGHPI
jgi:BMFP domain-containing protein YqiC